MVNKVKDKDGNYVVAVGAPNSMARAECMGFKSHKDMVKYEADNDKAFKRRLHDCDGPLS